MLLAWKSSPRNECSRSPMWPGVHSSRAAGATPASSAKRRQANSSPCMISKRGSSKSAPKVTADKPSRFARRNMHEKAGSHSPSGTVRESKGMEISERDRRDQKAIASAARLPDTAVAARPLSSIVSIALSREARTGGDTNRSHRAQRRSGSSPLRAIESSGHGAKATRIAKNVSFSSLCRPPATSLFGELRPIREL